MKYIQQLGIILGFALAGEIIARLVPGLLPASLTGLLLMLAALGLRLLRPEHIGECSDYLSSIMAFFFLPAAVTVIQQADLILPVIWQLIAIVIASTFCTFFVAYGTTRLLSIVLALSRKNKAGAV
jgi:holin-like protein